MTSRKTQIACELARETFAALGPFVSRPSAGAGPLRRICASKPANSLPCAKQTEPSTVLVVWGVCCLACVHKMEADVTVSGVKRTRLLL